MHALNLRKMDTLSKSDPCVVVSLRDTCTGPYVERGRTEIIKDNQYVQGFFFPRVLKLLSPLLTIFCQPPQLSHDDTHPLHI